MAVKKAAKKAAKKPATKPKPMLTGEQIEKELSLAHKMVAQAGATISLMLATRRLSVTRLQAAFEGVAACASHMERLVEILTKGMKK